MTNDSFITVKCNSHRARHKMYKAIGKHGEWYKLSPSAAKIALEITGISKSRDKGDLHKTWSFN